MLLQWHSVYTDRDHKGSLPGDRESTVLCSAYGDIILQYGDTGQ